MAPRVLLVFNSFGSMSQRVFLECQRVGCHVSCYEYESAEGMTHAVANETPDIIICPFLTKRVPVEIYSNTSVPCLIVHPGIEGDRGPSSIDWALLNGAGEWGVTILQADQEMDAGCIWATNNFTIQRPFGSTVTKSSLYRFECIAAAVEGVLHALEMFQSKAVISRPLDYTNPLTKGRLMPTMKQADRKIDWDRPAEIVCRTIRASDSQPGVSENFDGEQYSLYGAYVAECWECPDIGIAPPKSLLGKRDGAVLIKCGQGAVFVTHLKKPKGIKLPAAQVLPPSSVACLPDLPAPNPHLPLLKTPTTFQEIFWWEHKGACFLWFDFYNGAMNTKQCERLTQTLKMLEAQSAAKVLVMMGGLNFFSNGINLNTIEANPDPAKESWDNINAIDDVVKCVLMSSKITVSAFYGNAGAGGVMAPLAADHVWAHGGVVLNPSYKRMALYGSEYWTYSLVKRATKAVALRLTDSVDPISAYEAKRLGLVDKVLTPSYTTFVERVVAEAVELANHEHTPKVLDQKQLQITPEFEALIASHREAELQKMAICFTSESYISARKQFVHKGAALPCNREGAAAAAPYISSH